MAVGDTPANNDPKVEKLFRLISAIRTGMLVTQRSDGSLCSRPMATHTTDTDYHLWFLTDRDSVKVLEIAKNPNVNVSFADPDEQHYVSVSGKAAVVDDSAKLSELWNTFAKAWFTGGKDDSRLAMVRVEITDAEYWDAPSSAFVNLYRVSKALLTGKRPEDYGENETVSVSSE